MVNIFAPTPKMKPSAAVNIGHSDYSKKLSFGTIAPISSKLRQRMGKGISFTVMLFFVAIAAAQPATCPIAIQGA